MTAISQPCYGVQNIPFLLNRFLNIGVRGTTLGARFLFIFFLAKYLKASEVGYYGLFTATVGYALYFIGLDFYTYLTREILRAPKSRRGLFLKGQMALSGMLYLLVTPLLLVLLAFNGWPLSLLLWFVPLLFLELLNQELFRLLVALSEQLSASSILFLRQGSWAIASITLMHFEVGLRNLNTVLALWVCGGGLAAALGLRKVISLGMGGWREKLDLTWIRKGIAVSLLFLIATLSLRGIQTFDRYWLKDMAGLAVVGAYVLSIGVAGTLMVFLDAGIFTYTYPELVNHHHVGELREARRKVQRMLWQTLVISAGFAVVSWTLFPYLLAWINKPAYGRAMDLYPWLLLAMVVNALSMVPHYALYAQGRDRPIVYSHITALFAFAAATWVLSRPLSILAVPLGLCIAFSVILVWKTAAYLLPRPDTTQARMHLKDS